MARGSDARRHAAGDQAGKIERDIFVDDQDGRLIDDCVLGEAADHAESAHEISRAIPPAIAAVKLRTCSDARAVGAEMMQTAPAPVAVSARRNESQYDVIADANSADCGANFFNDAGSLVAEHHRPHGHAALAAHDVIICAAQTDGGNAHQDLGRRRRIERDALDRQRRAGVAE